jgi:dihydroorotase
MNRRELLRAGAATAACLAVAPRIMAQDSSVDLLLKGGRVIDPSLRLDAVRDIAIVGGRIAAVGSALDVRAATTLDVRGKLLVPGLIDIHTHAARDATGPRLCLADGVTGWIDAGSAGAEQADATVAVAREAPTIGRILLNIGRSGILADGDTKDLTLADVGAARDTIARHRDYIVGIKARLSETVVGANDVEVLRRAKAAAAPFGLPVMIHMGQTPSTLAQLLPLLERGDIVTHMFAPPPNAIVDERGRILPEVLAARRRGVLFDVGNGVVGHIRWDIVEQVMKAGFWPDTFSTDWNVNSRTTGVVDFPNCMSKLLGFGMSVADVVERSTWLPSRTFAAFADRGTLNVDAPADIAILELREGAFEYVDNYDNTIKATQRLFPAGTVLGGKHV